MLYIIIHIYENFVLYNIYGGKNPLYVLFGEPKSE